jgi:DNA-binding FadR family transcriptional regulator
MTDLEFVTRTTLAEQAAGQIRERIESKQWPVGTKLPGEFELAESLGVSRNTAREALRSLVHLGLLEARAGDGTYVRIASELEAVLRHRAALTKREEVLELRALLEEHAAGLAAQRRTQRDLERMRTLLVETRQAARSGDTAAHATVDGAFHLAVVRAGGNEFLADIYEQVGAAFRTLVVESGFDESTQNEHDRWHEALVDAIAAGDASGARLASAAVIDINRRFPTERRQEEV